LDSHIQAAVEKRGKELLGIALLTVGVLYSMMLASYVPEDPSWLSSTNAPVQNMLGRFGASLASPLFVTIGAAAWGIAGILLLWGVRYIFHMGDDRVFSRIIFTPIAIAFLALFASTHAPTEGWSHSFGLGGLFGDTALTTLLELMPVDVGIMLNLLTLIFGIVFVFMFGFVVGVSGGELRGIGRYLLVGFILSYASIVALLRFTGVRAMRGAVAAHMHHKNMKVARNQVMQNFEDTTLLPRRLPSESPAGSNTFVRRVPRLFAKTPQSELVEPVLTAPAPAPPSKDKIRTRITEAIRSRTLSQKQPLEIGRTEPPLEAIDDDSDETSNIFHSELPENSEFLQPTPESHARVNHRSRKGSSASQQAQSEAQPSLALEELMEKYEFPPLNLLSNPINIVRHHLSDEALEENARMLENVLDDYGVKGDIVSVSPGPVVTMYELEPAPGLKASRVIGLADDIARSMSALSARVSTVPGRSIIGIELPNSVREKVLLREILATRDFGDSTQKLPLALGKNIGGDPVVVNLAKMPHLLIAGTTGSGKSVAINTMILSLLYKLSPEECRMIMIDPKMLELSVYDGIPHLLSPVVTDPKKAVVALKWVVGEMEERYRKMSKMGVRNIDGYNSRVKDALSKNEMFKRTVQTGFDDETGDPVFETEEFAPEPMPYIVVVVDEMADLMMVAGKEIEACIQRLAQMARASGIHLIMATQRPSVDVITGTIKANFPTRISFQVTSKIDSRTILGEMGAEQLLGAGDMLYMSGGGKITRVHGPFVSDEEVEDVVNHLKSFGAPHYVSGVIEGPEDDKGNNIDQVLGLSSGNSEDELYDEAVAIVLRDRKCSTSYIQRKLAIGYNKAARLVEQMEDSQLVSPANHVGKREILVPESN